MFIYILIFSLLLFCKKYNNNYFFYSILLILITIVGLRHISVGTDTFTYSAYYNYVSAGKGYMEVLWNQLSIFVKSLGAPSSIFNLIVSALTLGIIGFILKKESRFPIVGLFFFYTLGFYLIMFNGMRQSLAMSITLLAYYFYDKKKIIYFFITIAIACGIHTTALLFVFVPLLKYIKLTYKNGIILALIFTLIGFLLSDQMFMSLSGKYAHDVVSFGIRSNLDAFIYIAFTNVFFFLIMKNIDKECYDNNWFKLAFFSLLIFNLIIRLTIGARIIYYFSMAEIIVFSNLLPKYPKAFKYSLIYASLTFIRFLLPELLYKYGQDGSLIPYKMDLSFFTFL